MKKGLFFLLLTLLLFPQLAIAQSDIGQEYQRWFKPFVNTAGGSEKVTVPAGTVIEDNFVRFANEITIEGDVMGDVIVAANKLTINGDVNGDVIAAAESIEINGEVAGNVRVAATDVIINNTVGKNVNVFGGTVILSDDASVGWTLSFFAGEVTVNSPVGGNIYGYGGQVTINNTVGNNVTLFFDETGQAILKSNAEIDGNFDYRGDKNAVIESNAVIKGNTVHKLIPTNILKARKFLSSAWVYGKIISLFSLLLVGTLLISLFHNKSREITKNLWPNPVPKMLWGFLLLIAVPIATIITAITIIGIPLSLIIIGIYILLVYVSKVFIGIFIGHKLLNIKDKKEAPLIWTMMLGVFIYFILTNIPYFGWIISLVGTVWFLGTIWKMILTYKNIKKEKINEKNLSKSI
jgi:cytoskeletal protein CcmA (bactofilin family)